MSRYSAMFERLRKAGDGAFGAFLMLGDPDLKASAGLLDALVEGGADMVEVGIPFSDPIADGPVIQAAARRALDASVRVDGCFELIAGFRERHPEIPVGILTYANLVVARGRVGFMKAAASAGADSLLVADVPAREAQPWTYDMQEAGIEPVLIAAANTPTGTLREITRLSKAFTYCVSRTGVTGIHADARFETALPAGIRDARGPPPIFGFGISRPEHVHAALAAGAAGAISGTAVVRLTLESEPRRRVVEFVASMKAATLQASAA